MQPESPRPQLIHASAQKPIAATQTGTQVNHGRVVRLKVLMAVSVKIVFLRM
jgi:hypothetical protein